MLDDRFSQRCNELDIGEQLSESFLTFYSFIFEEKSECCFFNAMILFSDFKMQRIKKCCFMLFDSEDPKVRSPKKLVDSQTQTDPLKELGELKPYT